MSKCLFIFCALYLSSWTLEISEPITIAKVSDQSYLQKIALGKGRIAVLWEDHFHRGSEYLNIIFKEGDQWTNPVRLNGEDQEIDYSHLFFDAKDQCHIFYSGEDDEKEFSLWVRNDKKWEKPTSFDEMFIGLQPSYRDVKNLCVTKNEELVLIEERAYGPSSPQSKSWKFDPKEKQLQTHILQSAPHSKLRKLVSTDTGEVYAFWEAETFFSNEIHVYRLEDAGWKEMNPLTLPNVRPYTPYTIDPFESPFLIYEDYNHNIFEAYLDDQGNWNYLELPIKGPMEGSSLCIDNQGNRVILIFSPYVLHAVYRSKDGQWICGESTPCSDCDPFFRVDVDSEGRFVMIWTEWDQIFGKTFSFADQKWSPSKLLVPQNVGESVVFAIKEDGTGMLAWIDETHSIPFSAFMNLKVAELFLDEPDEGRQ